MMFMLLALEVVVIAAVVLVWIARAAIVRKYRVVDDASTYRVCIAVGTNAAASRMWAVIADLGNIQRYMPALRSSTLLGTAPPGEGAVRACEDRRGHRWSERCVRWEPGRAFDVVFDTTSESFPFPFSAMRGGWLVDAEGEGCVVRVWWEVTPRRRWTGPLLLPLMHLGVRRDFRTIIARMATAAAGDEPAAIVRTARSYAC